MSTRTLHNYHFHTALIVLFGQNISVQLVLLQLSLFIAVIVVGSGSAGGDDTSGSGDAGGSGVVVVPMVVRAIGFSLSNRTQCL